MKIANEGSVRAEIGNDADLSFIERFRETHGRPLRVLHIGNIANNAYNNACIQRRYGIDADVVCYDYYHVMSCPEWEEEGFSGAVDHANPDWWATDLKGWRRPRWFAQGPALLCIDYLRARNAGQHFHAALKWMRMETVVRVRAHTSAGGDAARPRKLGFSMKLRRWVTAPPTPGRIRKAPIAAIPSSGTRTARTRAVGCLKLGLDRLRDVLLRRAVFPEPPPTESGLVAATRIPPGDREERSTRLIREMLERARRLDEAVLCDLKDYLLRHRRAFEPLLPHYDVIQGYSTDGFVPLVNGVRSFASYEHGTLREIPFEETLVGIVCRTTYQNSPAVFITNSDVLPSAERLSLKRERITCLPHAFDDRKLRAYRDAHPELVPPGDGPVVFFSPTRHHWKSGNTSWRKGNDVFLEAAGRLRRDGHDFRLIMVEWGADIAESRRLTGELDLTPVVQWVPAMNKQQLWKHYCTSHAVIDQFVSPALGGVGFESMALGRRLITAIDREQTRRFFGEAPPCLDARSVEACAARMREVIEDRDDARGRGPAASCWMGRYHSAERIVALQARAYRSLLAGIVLDP